MLEHIKGKKPNVSDNKWLGITYRVAKTFVNFEDNMPFLENGNELTLATDEQRDEFYILKSQENKGGSFNYPPINYTLSKADLLMPINHSDTNL